MFVTLVIGSLTILTLLTVFCGVSVAWQDVGFNVVNGEAWMTDYLA